MSRESALTPPAERTAALEEHKRSRTIAANDADALELATRRKNIRDAATYAVENQMGTRKVLSLEKFGSVTVNMVEPYRRYLKENGRLPDDRDHHRQILTNSERLKLAAWILACAEGQNPKDRGKVSVKVRQMLRARHVSNKSRKYGKGSILLNAQEKAALESKEARLSKSFFERFYPWCRAHGIGIEEGVDRAQDQQRSVMMTETVVNQHFYGEFGLEAELLAAGIMDPDTKVIKDTRRLLNMDETPQPLDAPQKGSRPKVGKSKGKVVRKATTTSKDILSLNMAWDASGHLYCLQLISKLKELHDGMAIKGPPGAPVFDDSVDLASKQSRTLLISRTDDGMQTQKSLLEYMQELDREITAHSDAAVAAGGEPIERPVVLMVDNHASRFSEELLKATTGQTAKFGIRLFTEAPKTSGFLQSLDQYNSTVHRRYNTARDVWKEAYEARYGKAPSFGLVEALKVLGGDNELGLVGMWFNWCSPYDVLQAWRKVGIAGNVLRPELIDRSEFIDQPAARPAAATPQAAVTPQSQSGRTTAEVGAASTSPRCSPRKRVADVLKTPPGVRSGTKAASDAKLAALTKLALQQEEQLDMPFDPTAAGVLVPDVVTRPDKDPSKQRKRRRLSDLHGSISIRGLGDECESRRLEDEAEVETVKARKEASAEKKAAAERETAERAAAFARCEVACACGVEPCPWEKWKRCPSCGPKLGLCKKRDCVAARKAAGPPPPADSPALGTQGPTESDQ